MREIAGLSGHSGPILGAAFSPDGKWLASAGDETIRLWNLERAIPTSTHSILPQESRARHRFIAVAYSPDGRYLAATTFDGPILVWDVRSNPSAPRHILRKHRGPVVALAFSPDAKRLVTGSRDEGLLCLWDVRADRIVESSATTEDGVGIWSLAFSPDGNTLAEGVIFRETSGRAGGEVRLLDVSRSPLAPRAVVAATRRNPRGIGYSPDGSTIAFGDWDSVRVFEAAGARELGAFNGHTSFVISLAFSPDGKSIISGGYDRILRLWRVEGFEEVYTSGPLAEKIEQVVQSRDGKAVAAVGHDRLVWLFEMDALGDGPGVSPEKSVHPIMGLWLNDRDIASTHEFLQDGKYKYSSQGMTGEGRWHSEDDRIVFEWYDPRTRRQNARWLKVASMGSGTITVLIQGDRAYTWKRISR